MSELQHIARSADLDALETLPARYEWAAAMAETPQDPTWHAEGDVWIHTKMVCAELIKQDEWQTLSPEEREIVFLAALLHDVGKPGTTRFEPGGRITSHGHAQRGEVLSRRILWELAVDFTLREQVAQLVRHHMQPRYVPRRRHPEHKAFAIAESVQCNLLALLAVADTLGRVSAGYEESLRQIARFREFCATHHCLRGPYPFASDHARFLFFHGHPIDPAATVIDDTIATFTLLCGLPGSGQDRWLEQHRGDAVVISLDAIRCELNIQPTQNQQRVNKRAREELQRALKAGQDVIWNATSLHREPRAKLIQLAAKQQARIVIQYIEVPHRLLLEHNRARSAPVPDEVFRQMLAIWHVPDTTEAHRVVYDTRRPASGSSAAA